MAKQGQLRKSDRNANQPIAKRMKLSPILIKYSNEYIPIRTLLVPAVPQTVTDEVLRQYFENFGPITRNDVIVDQNNAVDHKSWCVTFNKAESASKALSQEQHRISEVDVQVVAADGWLQYDNPKPVMRMQILAQDNDSTDVVEGSTSTTKFTDLNDDCVLHLCKFLDLATLSALADASMRYEKLATYIFKRWHKKHLWFDIGEPVDSARAFPIFGQYMENVHITCQTNYNLSEHEFDAKCDFYHKLIKRCCKNVNQLEWIFNEYAENLTGYFPSKQIKKLKLNCMWESLQEALEQLECLATVEHLTVCNGSIDYYLSRMMDEMPQLRTLHLSDMEEFDIDDLLGCTQLEELKMGGIDGIDEDGIVDIVRECTQLKRLKIVEMDFVLSEDSYLEIVNIIRDDPNRGKLVIYHYQFVPYAIIRCDDGDNKDFVEFHSMRPSHAELFFE